MQLEQLIAGLSRPAAYSHPAEPVTVVQTHISVVFLAGDFVYKIRKPVRLGFLDFSTLDLRHHDCEEEVRLNRRLAPDVYLDVVGITDNPDGVRIGGEGEVVEWAVKMRRLPAGKTLLDLLQRGELTGELVERVAGIIAEFHKHAEGGERVAAFGKLSVVKRNAIENFAESERDVGQTVDRKVFDRVRELTDLHLEALTPRIEWRAAHGVPRDTHGDLHLDHIYHLPGQPPPRDLIAIDCIEFNERFRFADPVADVAFLVMDLKFRGRRDLARAFTKAYFQASDDAEGRTLLRFYTAYRSVVRAKVEGITARETEVPAEVRDANRKQAQGHWLLALGELEAPNRRPALVLIGGLPGTGKSTLARELATSAFSILRTDEIRKEIVPLDLPRTSLNEGAYSPEWTARVYEECLRRAEEQLLAGGRVIVDANLREEAARQPFRKLAERLTVPLLFVVCEAPPEVAQQRLAERNGDASDANTQVYQWAATQWQEPGRDWDAFVLRVSTEASGAVEVVRQRLREDRLVE